MPPKKKKIITKKRKSLKKIRRTKKSIASKNKTTKKNAKRRVRGSRTARKKATKKENNGRTKAKKRARSLKALAEKEVKIPVKVEKFLVSKKAKYAPIAHRTVYTTFDAAMTLKVPPAQVAKTLLIKADRDLLMVVVPGNKNLDFTRLKKIINDYRKDQELKSIRKISLASEKLIENKFTKSPGVLPPFGELYDLDTYIDKALLRASQLILSSGLFDVSLQMSPAEFTKVVGGILGSFSKSR